jgi:ABC-type uncharacterized transport system substrate-binding protein
MRRREFIATLGTLPVWPLTARAQQRGELRKLGIIMAVGKTPEYVAALAALEQALESLGWKSGGNLRIDDRWSAGNEEAARSAAQEILGSKPDVILGQSAAVIQALRSTTQTTPIVFLHVADPTVYGFVSNLARPGGNVTGITNIIPSIGAKWLQLLKEIAPGVMRAAMLVNPETQPDRGAIFLNPFQDAARSLGVKSVNGEVHDLGSIEAVMAGLAKESDGGVIVIPDAFFASHSTQIVALADRFRLSLVIGPGGQSSPSNGVTLIRGMIPSLRLGSK